MTFRTEFKNSLKNLGASESDADSITDQFFVELANADDFTRKTSSSAVASFVYTNEDQQNSTSIAAAFINRARASAAAAFINIAGRSGQHLSNLAANFVREVGSQVAGEFVKAVKFVSSSEISKLNLPHLNYYEGQGYFHNDIFYVRRPEFPDGPPSTSELDSVEWAGGTVAGMFVATVDHYTFDGSPPSCTFVKTVGATEAASFVTRTMQTYGTEGNTDPQLAAAFVTNETASAEVAAKFVRDAGSVAAAEFVSDVTRKNSTAAAFDFVNNTKDENGDPTVAGNFVNAAGGNVAAEFVSAVGATEAATIAGISTTQSSSGALIKTFYDAIPVIKQGIHQIDNSTYIVNRIK